MGNRKLADNDRRHHGASIDAIITHLATGLEVGIVEVSGPPTMPCHSHFIDDREKIAVNLKKILKRILATYTTANFNILAKIMPIGIQVYDHQLFIYVLTMPSYDVFAFSKMAQVSLPVQPHNAAKDLSTLVATLWKVAIHLNIVASHLLECAVDFDSHDSLTITDISSAECSPRKTKKQKSSST